jgi:hypothetical protein
MGRIKSALEIALEKTDSVKSDKDAIEQFNAKQEGKKLANAFLSDGEIKLPEEIKKIPAAQRESLKQGIFDVLVSQISLPVVPDDEKRIDAIGRGLGAIISDSSFTMMYKQLAHLLSQYLKEAAQYDQALRQQYAPRLRKKEEELSRRLGQEVRLDPLQDNEFVQFYNQNMNALRANYSGAIEQVKTEARNIFEKNN